MRLPCIIKEVQDDTGVPLYRDHYVHDAQGNVMAIYRHTVGDGSLQVTERPIYGSSRLGSDAYAVELGGEPPFDPLEDPIGLVRYELTDHLGNVAVVITDELLGVDVDQDEEYDYFQPLIVSAQGYEPFGSLLPGRNYSSGSYRFGFNGMEKDDEMHGATGTSYDFGARMHDPRVGRFLSLDALASHLPAWSPYTAFGNNPVVFVDPDGNKFVFPEDKQQRRLVKATLRDLKRNSETAAFHIMRIARDPKEVKIVVSEGPNQFMSRSVRDATTPGKGSGGTLHWNPNDLNIAPDRQADGTTVVSPQRAFAEEMVHASRSIAGERVRGDSEAGFPDGYTSTWETANEELQTNQIVNTVLTEMGQSNKHRLTYTFGITKTDEEGAILDSRSIAVPIPGLGGNTKGGDSGSDIREKLPLILGSEGQDR